MQDGVEFDERDFFSDKFTEQELRQLIGEREPSEFFSWSSPSFRKMALKRDNLTGEQLIEMMLNEPRLIRRPLIRVRDDQIVGTDKTAMSQAYE